MTGTHNRTRFLAVAVAAGCAGGLTACGSSGKPSGHAGVSTGNGIRFAQCMRSHGLSDFPDPGSGGGIQLPPGTNPFSPAFRAAQKDCQSLMPGGGPGRAQDSAARKQQLVNLAECMRRHGITTFPDPTSSPPTSPPAGGGFAIGAPGVFLSVPGSLMQSPGFQQDAKACGVPGGGGPPSGRGGKATLKVGKS